MNTPWRPGLGGTRRRAAGGTLWSSDASLTQILAREFPDLLGTRTAAGRGSSNHGSLEQGWRPEAGLLSGKERTGRVLLWFTRGLMPAPVSVRMCVGSGGGRASARGFRAGGTGRGSKVPTVLGLNWWAGVGTLDPGPRRPESSHGQGFAGFVLQRKAAATWAGLEDAWNRGCPFVLLPF